MKNKKEWEGNIGKPVIYGMGREGMRSEGMEVSFVGDAESEGQGGNGWVKKERGREVSRVGDVKFIMECKKECVRKGEGK